MDERLIRIADHYGLNSQLNILQEECAELIQAVSKYQRHDKFNSIIYENDKKHLAEEIADVEVMINQIKYMMNLAAVVDSWKEKKICRQLERMDGEAHG